MHSSAQRNHSRAFRSRQVPGVALPTAVVRVCVYAKDYSAEESSRVLFFPL